jgi:dephospho-CoA kinase
MKKVVFVTGPMGAGKSTFIADMLRSDEYIPLFVGRICREKFGAISMSGASNPTAPEETEAFVRELVINSIVNLPEGKTLIVDGVPRKPSQVVWLAEEVRTLCKISIVYIKCDHEERVRRLTIRDTDSGAKALMKARLNTETTSFMRVLEEMWTHFPSEVVSFIDNSKDDFEKKSLNKLCADMIDSKEVIDAGNPYSSFSFMWKKHEELQRVTLANIGISYPEVFKDAVGVNEIQAFSDPVIWARRYLEKVIEEANEALQELPSNWWAVDPADLRATRVECVDILHFLLSAMMSLGLDPISSAKLYHEKRDVNMNRALSRTYSKKNKVGKDDEHIGK